MSKMENGSEALLPPARSSDVLWRGPNGPVVAFNIMDARKRETRPCKAMPISAQDRKASGHRPEGGRD